MMELLHKDEEIRTLSLVMVEGVAVKHTGDAKHVYKMNLPLNVEVAKLLFAILSIDDTLPKRKKPRLDNEEVVQPVLDRNIGRDLDKRYII